MFLAALFIGGERVASVCSRRTKLVFPGVGGWVGGGVGRERSNLSLQGKEKVLESAYAACKVMTALTDLQNNSRK